MSTLTYREKVDLAKGVGFVIVLIFRLWNRTLNNRGYRKWIVQFSLGRFSWVLCVGRFSSFSLISNQVGVRLASNTRQKEESAVNIKSCKNPQK